MFGKLKQKVRHTSSRPKIECLQRLNHHDAVWYEYDELDFQNILILLVVLSKSLVEAVFILGNLVTYEGLFLNIFNFFCFK